MAQTKKASPCWRGRDKTTKIQDLGQSAHQKSPRNPQNHVNRLFRRRSRSDTENLLEGYLQVSFRNPFFEPTTPWNDNLFYANLNAQSHLLAKDYFTSQLTKLIQDESLVCFHTLNADRSKKEALEQSIKNYFNVLPPVEELLAEYNHMGYGNRINPSVVNYIKRNYTPENTEDLRYPTSTGAIMIPSEVCQSILAGTYTIPAPTAKVYTCKASKPFYLAAQKAYFTTLKNEVEEQINNGPWTDAEKAETRQLLATIRRHAMGTQLAEPPSQNKGMKR